MKFLVVLFTLFAFSCALKCHKTDNGTVASADCAADDTKCSGPVFVEYTGIKNATVVYNCGECTANQTADGTCVECETDDCNAIVAGEDFMCDAYEFKTDAFVKSETQETCKRLKATDAKCKLPGAKATAADSFSSSCGVCTQATLDDGTCKNGSIAAVFSTVLALFVLFNLL